VQERIGSFEKAEEGYVKNGMNSGRLIVGDRTRQL